MRLGPEITPTVYRRPSGEESQPVGCETYRVTQVNESRAREVPQLTVPEDDMIVYHGEVGEVILNHGKFHVQESVYRGRKMVMIREMCADVMQMLNEKEVIEYEVQS